MGFSIQNPKSKIQNRKWHLVTVTVAREGEEQAGSLLFDLGATGIVTLEETSNEIKLGAYFDATARPEEIVGMVGTEFARAGLERMLFGLSVTEILDQDWMQKWKEGFEPVNVGSRLVIAPSWKLPEINDERVVVEIDPGMAFGTGTHETTRMCLEAIEELWKGGHMLDVGTGTGILAIAAARLAPGSQVTAIDIDPQAVAVARENAEINRASALMEITEGVPRDFTGRNFDMVVANLTAEVIIDLMDDLAGCLKESGTLILSGILIELQADVERSIARSRLTIMKRRVMGEWCSLVAGKGEG
ncbi:MAG TPA: 50S ribosomal protein L11 methyltransferase [Blastocatellia bacterium]|nr:50S ribosomal protein L11 methyltransferase [Blastocatellia bacterium]